MEDLLIRSDEIGEIRLLRYFRVFTANVSICELLLKDLQIVFGRLNGYLCVKDLETPQCNRHNSLTKLH